MPHSPAVFIRTKFLAPTSTLGARVVARTVHLLHPESVTVAWNHTLGTEANHEAAARALISRRLGPKTGEARAAAARLLGVHQTDGMLYAWE